MKRSFFVTFLIIINLLMIFSLHGYTSDKEMEELKLYLGQVEILPVHNPTRIIISNPSIADITNVTREEMTIAPKGIGTTTLIFWDNYGEQSYRIRVFAEDINEIKRRVDNMLKKLNLPDIYTQAEEEEGKVILLGKVKSPQDRERINVALGTLKDKTVELIEVKEEEAAVEIDVQLLELNKDATNTLGFSFPGSITITERGSPAIQTSTQQQVGTTSTISGGTAIGTKWSNLFRVLNVSREAFTLSIDALVQEGKAKILSRPRLACQSGKEAELLVGGEKPIFTTQVVSGTGGTGTEVEYKEYGIKLKIKPTVVDEERIKLALNVEVSELGTVEYIGSSSDRTAQAYPLVKRNASTELFLNDGQTMAIGGLIKQKSEQDIRKTPWLGDVPLLGLFFRKTTTKKGGGTGERGDTELFITLTPKIISALKKQITPVVSQGEEIKIERASSTMTDVPQSIAGYASILQKRILEKVVYPSAARAAGFKGAVGLRLHLSFTGELLEAKVKNSSGYKILDDNALATAKEISSYPPFPSSIEEKELWIDVPIVYKLD